MNRTFFYNQHSEQTSLNVNTGTYRLSFKIKMQNNEDVLQSCKISIFIVSDCIFIIVLYWNSMQDTCQSNLHGAWK